jgi:hypothetical protein
MTPCRPQLEGPSRPLNTLRGSPLCATVHREPSRITHAFEDHETIAHFGLAALPPRPAGDWVSPSAHRWW